MPRHDTIKSVITPVVLVVEVAPEFAEQCLQAAQSLDVEVLVTTQDRVVPAAAEYRPFAIVMTDTLYEMYQADHEALAKDVGARIIRISDRGIPSEALKSLLSGTLLESTWRRGSSGA